ncbi:MAG: hypothetical protein KAS73_05230 [Candidatus Sabulitectum sp.]|nr:hypothetical protein [Candidatus Sabulitectum sp.]
MANESKTTKIIRWTARITSAVTALIILMFFIGEDYEEGYQPLLNLSLKNSLLMVAFFALWLGLILGWKWELKGGLLTICGLAAFYLINYLFSGSFPRGPFFLIFASPGFLYLYLGIACRKPGWI